MGFTLNSLSLEVKALVFEMAHWLHMLPLSKVSSSLDDSVINNKLVKDVVGIRKI